MRHLFDVRCEHLVLNFRCAYRPYCFIFALISTARDISHHFAKLHYALYSPSGGGGSLRRNPPKGSALNALFLRIFFWASKKSASAERKEIKFIEERVVRTN